MLQNAMKYFLQLYQNMFLLEQSNYYQNMIWQLNKKMASSWKINYSTALWKMDIHFYKCLKLILMSKYKYWRLLTTSIFNIGNST